MPRCHMDSSLRFGISEKRLLLRLYEFPLLVGSYSTMYPATALAATVYGLAKNICPGPLRPGKLRFCAPITVWSDRVETPGPAFIHAPQLGSITVAPACLKMST